MNREKAFSHPSSLSPLPPHLALPSHACPLSWMCPRVPLCATSTGATPLPAAAENCRYCVSGPGEAPTSTRRGIKAACGGTHSGFGPAAYRGGLCVPMSRLGLDAGRDRHFPSFEAAWCLFSLQPCPLGPGAW